MPVLAPAPVAAIPTMAIPFNSSFPELPKLDTGLHFYCEDRKFISVVADPVRWVTPFSAFKCVFTPDISLSQSLAQWQRVKNTVYSRAIGATWQRRGLTVIPSLRWVDKADYEFVSDGIGWGSVVAFGALGTYRDSSKRQVFQHGVDAMLERINPQAIIIYGKLDNTFRSRLDSKVELHNLLSPRASRNLERADGQKHTLF